MLPGLEVKGVGSIGSPVTAADAKRLIAKATQAPYGRGEATIVDVGVRRVWQVEPSQFVLRNAEWDTHLAAIVDVVKREFGIRQKVSPQLYKLLIYEKGSFFAAPPRQREGAGHVRHVDRVPAVAPQRGNPDRHARRPDEEDRLRRQGRGIQDAIRRVLRRLPARDHAGDRRVSDLPRLQPRDRGKEEAALGTQKCAAIEKAAQLLGELFADPSGEPSKIAIPFEHQYTQAGLDPKATEGCRPRSLSTCWCAPPSHWIISATWLC